MKIRLATAEDAGAIADIYKPIVLETTISFEWVPPTVDDFRSRIVKTLARYPWLVAVDAGDAVAGYVCAGSHRDPPSYQWSVNTSVFIRDGCRGQGLGKALYAELFRQLVSLGYYRAFAGIALPNEGSVALHESVGFQRLGVYEQVGYKFGAWRDVAWFQKQLQLAGHEAPKPPLRPGRKDLAGYARAASRRWLLLAARSTTGSRGLLGGLLCQGQHAVPGQLHSKLRALAQFA